MNYFCRLKYFLFFLFLSLIFNSIVFAENNSLSDEAQLTFSMTELLELEGKSISKLDVQIAEEEVFSKNLLLEFSSFRLQFSTRANLILSSETPVKNLEKANEEHIVALYKIREKINEINQRAKGVEALIETTSDQISINEKQLNSLRTERNKTKNVKALISGYQSLHKKMLRKKELLTNLKNIYRSVNENIIKVEQDFALLSDKFENEIKKRKRKDLFQKNDLAVGRTTKSLSENFQKLITGFKPLLSLNFWVKETGFVKTAGSLNIIVFLVLFCFVLFIFTRLKNQLKLWNDKEILKTFWIQLAMNIIERTHLLLSIVVFLFVFSQSGLLYSKTPLLLMVLNLSAVFLFSKWFLILNERIAFETKNSITKKTTVNARHFILLLRIFAMICIIGNWLYADVNIIFTIVRVLFLIFLFVWCIYFWENIFKGFNEAQEQSLKSKETFLAIVKYLIYAIIVTGIVADLMGYGKFAFYWLTSWARSSVIILWFIILFFCAGELSKTKTVQETQPIEEYDVTSVSIHWFISRIGLVIVSIIMIVSIVFAWGGKQAVLINIYQVLAKPITIGSWEISFLHIVYSIIALFITNAVAVTWRQFFQNVILKESGIDIGVQDSVSTLSYYIIWFVGILLSLNLFGVSMKSVTLIFGALGIGLGFGLQNIFNNFISGIILLFERPIQVGDDLEIDGVWATVKKINVRSTVVQTYDNATLIIPNSEFVSAKVVNWSFKDKRIRRVIEVGVAYGSDIELVRKTLLEVANTTPRVLKLPKPDVHFTKFDDSALTFKLRIWTRVEYFMAVETETRFKIDQLFRENNIEISFPQRDIHIKTINKAVKSPETLL